MDKTSAKIIESMTGEKVPYIGMGATIYYGSDAHPYTIVHINETGKRMRIQADNWKRVDKNGYGGEQVYEYSTDPNGVIEVISLRKDGKWRTSPGNSPVNVGTRRKYDDPHF